MQLRMQTNGLTRSRKQIKDLAGSSFRSPVAGSQVPVGVFRGNQPRKKILRQPWSAGLKTESAFGLLLYESTPGA
jgi:hypothetical protein